MHSWAGCQYYVTVTVLPVYTDNTGATEIAGVDNVARRSKGGQRGSGQGGTKKQGWTTQE